MDWEDNCGLLMQRLQKQNGNQHFVSIKSGKDSAQVIADLVALHPANKMIALLNYHQEETALSIYRIKADGTKVTIKQKIYGEKVIFLKWCLPNVLALITDKHIYHQIIDQNFHQKSAKMELSLKNEIVLNYCFDSISQTALLLTFDKNEKKKFVSECNFDKINKPTKNEGQLIVMKKFTLKEQKNILFSILGNQKSNQFQLKIKEIAQKTERQRIVLVKLPHFDEVVSLSISQILGMCFLMTNQGFMNVFLINQAVFLYSFQYDRSKIKNLKNFINLDEKLITTNKSSQIFPFKNSIGTAISWVMNCKERESDALQISLKILQRYVDYCQSKAKNIDLVSIFSEIQNPRQRIELGNLYFEKDRNFNIQSISQNPNKIQFKQEKIQESLQEMLQYDARGKDKTNQRYIVAKSQIFFNQILQTLDTNNATITFLINVNKYDVKAEFRKFIKNVGPLQRVDENCFYSIYLKRDAFEKFNQPYQIRKTKKNDYVTICRKALLPNVLNILSKIQLVQQQFRRSPTNLNLPNANNQNGLKGTQHQCQLSGKGKRGQFKPTQSTTMNGSANQLAVQLQLLPINTFGYEWLHLIAFNLNQNKSTRHANTANNLVFGTCEANTYMLQYEDIFEELLRGKKEKGKKLQKATILLATQTKNFYIKTEYEQPKTKKKIKLQGYTTMISQKLTYNCKIKYTQKRKMNSTMTFNLLSAVQPSPIQKTLFKQLINEQLKQPTKKQIEKRTKKIKKVVKAGKIKNNMGSNKLRQQSDKFVLWSKQYDAICKGMNQGQLEDVQVIIKADLTSTVIQKFNSHWSEIAYITSIIQNLLQIKQFRLFASKQSQLISYEFTGKIRSKGTIMKQVFQFLNLSQQKLDKLELSLIIQSTEEYYDILQNKCMPQNFAFGINLAVDKQIFSGLVLKSIECEYLVQKILNLGQTVKWSSEIWLKGQMDIVLSQSEKIHLTGEVLFTDQKNWQVTASAQSIKISSLTIKNITVSFEKNSNQYCGLINGDLQIDQFCFGVGGIIKSGDKYKQLGVYGQIQKFQLKDLCSLFASYSQSGPVSCDFHINFKDTYISFATDQLNVDSLQIKKGLGFHTSVQFSDFAFMPKEISVNIQLTKKTIEFTGKISQLSFNDDLKVKNCSLVLKMGKQTQFNISSCVEFMNMKIQGQFSLCKIRQRCEYFFVGKLQTIDLNDELKQLTNLFKIESIQYQYNSCKRSEDSVGKGHIIAFKISKFKSINASLALLYYDQKISCNLEGNINIPTRIDWLDISLQKISIFVELSPFKAGLAVDIKLNSTVFKFILEAGVNSIYAQTAITMSEDWENPFRICDLLGLPDKSCISIGKKFELGFGITFQGIPQSFDLVCSFRVGKMEFDIRKFLISLSSQTVTLAGSVKNVSSSEIFSFIKYLVFKEKDENASNRFEIFKIKLLDIDFNLKPNISKCKLKFLLQEVTLLQMIKLKEVVGDIDLDGIYFKAEAEPFVLGPLSLTNSNCSSGPNFELCLKKDQSFNCSLDAKITIHGLVQVRTQFKIDLEMIFAHIFVSLFGFRVEVDFKIFNKKEMSGFTIEGLFSNQKIEQVKLINDFKENLKDGVKKIAPTNKYSIASSNKLKEDKSKSYFELKEQYAANLHKVYKQQVRVSERKKAIIQQFQQQKRKLLGSKGLKTEQMKERHSLLQKTFSQNLSDIQKQQDKLETYKQHVLGSSASQLWNRCLDYLKQLWNSIRDVASRIMKKLQSLWDEFMSLSITYIRLNSQCLSSAGESKFNFSFEISFTWLGKEHKFDFHMGDQPDQTLKKCNLAEKGMQSFINEVKKADYRVQNATAQIGRYRGKPYNHKVQGLRIAKISGYLDRCSIFYRKKLYRIEIILSNFFQPQKNKVVQMGSGHNGQKSTSKCDNQINLAYDSVVKQIRIATLGPKYRDEQIQGVICYIEVVTNSGSQSIGEVFDNNPITIPINGLLQSVKGREGWSVDMISFYYLQRQEVHQLKSVCSQTIQSRIKPYLQNLSRKNKINYCQNKHRLEPLFSHPSYYNINCQNCDICHRKTQPSIACYSLHCKLCNFDVCSICSNPYKDFSPEHFAQAQCPKKHKMKQSDLDYLGFKASCDLCRSQIDVYSYRPAFKCKLCDFDLCNSCLNKSLKEKLNEAKKKVLSNAKQLSSEKKRLAQEQASNYKKLYCMLSNQKQKQ